MPKTVREEQFKIFTTYEDALANSNFTMEIVEFEGGCPPDQIWSKGLSAFCLLKTFSRWDGYDKFFEHVYLKQ